MAAGAVLAAVAASADASDCALKGDRSAAASCADQGAAPTRNLKADPVVPPSAEAGRPPGAGTGSLLASRVIGGTLRDPSGEELGTITDVMLDADLNPVSAIVRIGGFLGFGGRDVAVPVSRISVGKSDDGTASLTIAATAAQLEEAPSFDRTALMR